MKAMPPPRFRARPRSRRSPSFSSRWGYFHALHQRTEKTDGHRLHQVLYARGRGHWVGMTLYKTGHDHGGGDFAVIDGEGDRPAFLHGVNGEDYFTFAWFGKGAHHPYAVAHSNDEGRYRHHFENVYPFQKSIAIEWGAFAELQPGKRRRVVPGQPRGHDPRRRSASGVRGVGRVRPGAHPPRPSRKGHGAPLLGPALDRGSGCREAIRVHVGQGTLHQRLDAGLVRRADAEPYLYRAARHQDRLRSRTGRDGPRLPGPAIHRIGPRPDSALPLRPR